MASEPDSWAGKFLDYVGLGLILTGVDIMVREGAISTGVGLLTMGAVALLVGLNWSSIQPKLSDRFVSSLSMMAHDARYWFMLLVNFVLAARLPSLLYPPLQPIPPPPP